MITDSSIKPNATFSFVVSGQPRKTRIDSFIASQFSAYSRSFISKLFAKQLVAKNGVLVHKNGEFICDNDVITVQFPPERTIVAPQETSALYPVEVVDEQEHFLIICKPAGLVVHPPSKHCPQYSLTDWLLATYPEMYGVGTFGRPGIIHRLDKDTSGLMVIPRTNYAFTVFGDLFRSRTIYKTYMAVVEGHPEKIGMIDLPIGRDPYKKIKMKAFSPSEQEKFDTVKMRDSITEFCVSQYYQKHTLVRVTPKTGRTHQIRAHFAAIGHPLLGDAVYGKQSAVIPRHALHASKLSFIFDQKEYSYDSIIAKDILSALSHL